MYRFALLLAVSSYSLASEICVPIKVIDGDTIVCAIDGKIERVRLYGVDTPEMRGSKCKEIESAKANGATQLTNYSLFSSCRAVLEKPNEANDRDKWGRLLRRVKLYNCGAAGGTDLSGLLILKGLGVPYAGGKRIDWCNK